jgi:hypothetical protein
LDTYGPKREIFRFIVLFPHRDALVPFHEYREKLFTGGFSGAYSFPLCVPLAQVSHSFSKDELRQLGRKIRELTKEKDGKITGDSKPKTRCTGWEPQPSVTAAGTGIFTFFGPQLNLPADEDVFPTSATDKVFTSLLPPVLCTALIETDTNYHCEKLDIEVPVLSFRAAALANLAISTLDCGNPFYSFKWKISPLIWLPSKVASVLKLTTI